MINHPEKSKPNENLYAQIYLFADHYSPANIALCADPAMAQLKIDYGKSYLNITKGATGGTIEPGDILEVRATFVVGGSGVNDYADSCAYFDVVPANTTYIPGSLAILTNEGHSLQNLY